jgi:hypothetical protein
LCSSRRRLDLSISLIWNPTVGSTLAKAATALILLDWHQKSRWRTGITAGIAWCAVQAYTGAVFVALGVFTALIAGPLSRGDRRTAYRNGAIVAGIVALLQVPLRAPTVESGRRQRHDGGRKS